MELNTIRTTVNWGTAAYDLNSNFEKVNVAVEQVKSATIRIKGYFSSSDELIAEYPRASIGDIAYVKSEGYDPYERWVWNGSSWEGSGLSGGNDNVNLGNYYNKEQVDNLIKPCVYDGGRADSLYGGARTIDCGNAYY